MYIETTSYDAIATMDYKALLNEDNVAVLLAEWDDGDG